jgi:hypothetical protein
MFEFNTNPKPKESTLTCRQLLLTLPMLILAANVALAAPAKELRTLKGTWMCPECASMKQADTAEQCEAKGHRHALKLDDGQIITFVDSPRAAALIHGGGRDKAKIDVCGFYDAQAKTLDIEAYRIDKLWTSWCDTHGRMDTCRSIGEPQAQASASSAK